MNTIIPRYEPYKYSQSDVSGLFDGQCSYFFGRAHG